MAVWAPPSDLVSEDAAKRLKPVTGFDYSRQAGRKSLLRETKKRKKRKLAGETLRNVSLRPRDSEPQTEAGPRLRRLPLAMQPAGGRQ